MKFKFFPDEQIYPQDEYYVKGKGSVGREIKKLSKKRPDLYLLVETFLKKLSKENSIEGYLRSGDIFNFNGKDKELYEMRIPPTRKGGVFRIYFCFSKNSNETDTLILLFAELKHDTEPEKLDSARKNLKNYIA